MTAPTETCPSCHKTVEASPHSSEQLRFCTYCQHPLVLVADKYQLQRQISEGGYGRIFLAKHIHLKLEPMRVIKFIKPEVCSNPTTVKRMAREVEVTAALSQMNQHIVRVYDDFGQLPQLGHYYVMEYLDGDDLAEKLDLLGPLPFAKLLHIMKQVCDGMQEAHSKGVIHRDLKPSNIFLTRRGEDPLFAKVIDFGIAKHLNAENQTQLTGGIIGTPEYMAPEQCSGATITPATDVYALGVIMYKIFTGFTPFRLPSMEPAVATAIIMSHLTKPPPLLSTVTPREIPKGFQEVISRCLEKDPAKRFPTAKELKRALMDLDTNTPQEAPLPPQDLSQRAEKAPPLQRVTKTHTEEPPMPMGQLPSVEAETPEKAPLLYKRATAPKKAHQGPQLTHETGAGTKRKRLLFVGGGGAVLLMMLVAAAQFINPAKEHQKPSPQKLQDASPPTKTPEPPRTTTTKHTPTPQPQKGPNLVAKPKMRPKPKMRRRLPKRTRRPRRGSKRKHTRRRARRRTHQAITRICPPATDTYRWIRIKRITPHLHIESPYKQQQGAQGHICLRVPKGPVKGPINIRSAGFFDCLLVTVPAHITNITGRLRKQTRQAVDPGLSYCLK